ncbi:hypothetical protein PPERSA_07102 [Pseudocohnilembus persalinus]|uniref:Uncharacterized protein n=1 Tax=Pseudocohnilembus persalinus TaxID=266149 RepID=A0A0V0QXH5_PSEPJ|nr:hypothetical protein PPERSA_07102 [Pseudocohnilembus persalinus]|eukprot:KRX06939.1 hypothetical protein PPERSA_07102 [Pseudocohnilembus persalinus]
MEGDQISLPNLSELLENTQIQYQLQSEIEHQNIRQSQSFLLQQNNDDKSQINEYEKEHIKFNQTLSNLQLELSNLCDNMKNEDQCMSYCSNNQTKETIIEKSLQIDKKNDSNLQQMVEQDNLDKEQNTSINKIQQQKQIHDEYNQIENKSQIQQLLEQNKNNLQKDVFDTLKVLEQTQLQALQNLGQNINDKQLEESFRRMFLNQIKHQE